MCTSKDISVSANLLLKLDFNVNYMKIRYIFTAPAFASDHISKKNCMQSF